MEQTNLPNLLPHSGLLPLRGLAVTLEFTAEARFSFFHQPALHAFIRHLLDSPEDIATLLTLDTPESGRNHFRAGDRYCFAIIVMAGGEGLLVRLMNRLRELPASAKRTDLAIPLRDNLRLVELRDLLTDKPVKLISDLHLFDHKRLEAEVALWQFAPAIILRWLSPARLLREKGVRGATGGEGRYCREVADLTPGPPGRWLRSLPGCDPERLAGRGRRGVMAAPIGTV